MFIYKLLNLCGIELNLDRKLGTLKEKGDVTIKGLSTAPNRVQYKT